MIFVALAALALSSGSPTCPADASPSALLCRAVEASDAKNYAEAAGAFEAAANASPPSEEKTLRMWAAAGNSWILAGQAGRAASALDKALATPGLDQAQVGFAELDRGRAAEMQGDLKAARRFAERAKLKIPDDPFVPFFMASLSLREGDVPAAKVAITEALRQAPDSAEIQFEAGHVAEAAGDTKAARDYWQKAIELDPTGPSGAAARKAMSMLTVPLTVAPASTAPASDGKGSKPR